MTNVLSLPTTRQGGMREPGALRLLDLAAHGRHDPQDVRWLKENAEVLRLLVTCGQAIDPAVLHRTHGEVARSLPERLAFFPQYYRFFLSIALDLSALGLRVDARGLVAGALADGLAEAELSDLQRAEARLFAERAGLAAQADPDLTARLLRFAARAETFALPNKKAAYELTHIAFYLSDYGTREFEGAARLVPALMNVGQVAWLEQNTDLLAETCIALRHCGAIPPQIWDRSVAQDLEAFSVAPAQAPPAADDFHCWMMAAWAQSVAGGRPMDRSLPSGALRFDAPHRTGALHELSLALIALGRDRQGDWPAMRPRLLGRLSPLALALLDTAAQATEGFDSFFARFVRAPARGQAA